MILVIDKRDTIVRYVSGTLRIEQNEKKLQRIPINQIEQFIVYGNPLIESAVWRILSSEKIPAVLLASRGLAEAAHVGSGLAVQLPIRRLQHRCADNSCALSVARWFVDAKFLSYDLPLSLLVDHYSLTHDELLEFQCFRNRARVKLIAAQDVAELMGFEGSVAKAWFSLLKSKLPEDWKFTGRNRQPPKDPVNALLSLGYTLLMSDIRQALLISGFDTSLGFLHQQAPGRESLVLDFTEIFRTGVDYFVLNWLKDIPVNSVNFYYREDEGCRMSKSLRPVFFEAWADYRNNWYRPMQSFEVYDADNPLWPTAPLREQMLGRALCARLFMQNEMDNIEYAA